jgi:hypothetical protein
MSAPIPLRRDFDASQLRGFARKTKDGPQARRLLALAAIYDGGTRTEAAKIGGARVCKNSRECLHSAAARGLSKRPAVVGAFVGTIAEIPRTSMISMVDGGTSSAIRRPHRARPRGGVRE